MSIEIASIKYEYKLKWVHDKHEHGQKLEFSSKLFEFAGFSGRHASWTYQSCG